MTLAAFVSRSRYRVKEILQIMPRALSGSERDLQPLYGHLRTIALLHRCQTTIRRRLSKVLRQELRGFAVARYTRFALRQVSITQASSRAEKVGRSRLAVALALGTLFCSLATAPLEARAGEYPDRPIKLIVPTTAGSLPDVVARLIGDRLAASIKHPVVVENRPGAIGTIGLNAVAKASPDGYTLGMISAPYLVAPSLIAHMPYDVENDLSPVAVICWNYQILTIRSDLPVRSVPELIAEAKSRPGALKYSSPGNATPPHLGMKLFERRTGIELVHVPYKGGPAAVTALLRGDVDIYLAGMLTTGPYLKSGALRLLATFAPRRLAANPELPTMIELGYPDVEFTDWQGIVAPAGTPADVIERLSRELANIIATPDLKLRLEQLSMEPATLGPVEFGRLIRRESQKWNRLVREAHITVD